LLLIGLLAEGVVRLVGTYDPFEMNFYAKHSEKRPGRYETPYGVMRMNQHGFPDGEFDLEDPRPRVGYFGDSVTFGLGAGYGHRISDHLRTAFPRFQHLTFAQVGGGFQVTETTQALDLTERFGVDRYVYLMNLNDLLPSYMQTSDPSKAPLLRRLLYGSAFQYVDRLRMHSHLYNFLRTRVRNAVAQRGFSHQGFEAYELWPTKYSDIIDGVTGRINDFDRQLRVRGVTFCIAILPYEIQISREAEQYYAGLGFRWEEGFVDRTTQQMIRKRLDPGIQVVDTYSAFVRDGAEVRSREDNRLGEFFIARAGGAIDWDHPNRAGHRAIADFLIEQDFCRLSDASPGDGASS
ncbi:MAG: hypothetical protein ACREQL_12445, partial [Candidatus Binatia bacterium]